MKKVAVLLLGSMVLTGCGSDESSDSRASNTYMGEIESVDQSNSSVSINSMSLDASHAEIKLNDMPINLIELDKGMQVDIEYDHGVAYEIELEPIVVGEVSQVSATDITINGQIFKHDGLTSNSNIAVNRRAMLFGYLNSSKEWVITAVYNADFLPNDVHEGPVSDLNQGTNTFKLNSTIVESKDYDDLNELRNGVWVEVEGTYHANTFIATDVDVEDVYDFSNVEMEGYITDINAEKTSMTLSSRTKVTITENTRFFKEDLQGNDIACDNSILALGAKVEVDLINKNGELEATEIELDND
ncbi:hypothetical protein GNP89_14710 [Aliivibrio fischeri]|uniref:DUF5666 domain-containing protein n=1 Tax=Aliivibrio fischeri TaxID=668 RepID=UPI0012D9F935|nr:DUF5666 domain-containing protein [Aliivibrio fischeri]MUL03432.1 hypothetical protein [Aliivibrio fischeri]